MSLNKNVMKSVWAAMMLIAGALTVSAQNVTVKGVVTEPDGTPMISAGVMQRGSANGTVTDLDGQYSITVPSDAVLVFSAIGFKEQEVSVSGRTTVNVVMEPDYEMLDDVVVIGYGQMKRSDVTGAVISISDDAIRKSVPTSIDQVLQGRAAGVQIQANSGAPGASSAIRIRGINSLNATNQPIFVIDGVVIDSATSDANSNPLSTINPADIVTMDILKDASATAIYGSRASNGVIMITTKRGKSGEATITYDGYAGWQEMPKFLEVMNLREYAEHFNARADAGIVASSSAFVRPDLLGEGTDWQRELFRKALMHSHNLSATGGNENVTYAIGVGYLQQDGIALGSGFDRLSVRANLDAQIKKWLKSGLSFSFANTKQQVGVDNNIIMNSLRQQPMVAVTNVTGGFDGPEDEWMPENAVALAQIVENHNKKLNTRFNTYLEATITDGLTFKTEWSADYNLNKDYFYQPDYVFGIKSSTIRTARWTESDTQYWAWRNILTYDKAFGRHAINAMLGQEMSYSHWEQQGTTATGFLSNTAHDPSAGDSSKSSGTGTQFNSSLSSFFGRLFYSYDDRYLITLTLRRDGSSRFAPGKQWGWFPSAAFAWKMSNESFLADNPVINNMKLRLGFGATGNQNVGNWAYMALLSSKTTPWGVGVLNGNTANPDLRWETTYSGNVGYDLSLFQNRIEFIADLYYKRTKDLLLQIELPAYLGSSGPGAASNPWSNIGSLENKGIELTLNTVNIDNRDFSWRSNFVFSLNRNRVISLDSESGAITKTYQVGSDTQTVTRTSVGQPIGQFWGYKVIGRFNNPEDFYYKDENGNIKPVALPDGSSIEESKTWIGDYIFADLNKDGKIDNEDCTFIGNPEPKFTYGIGNTFSWKGFDLTLFFSGSYGNDVYNWNRRWIESPRENTNLLKTVKGYAVVEQIDPDGSTSFRNYHVSGGDPYMPRLSASTTNANNRPSDLYIEDGSYIRLQNLSLAYNFRGKWLNSAGISNLRAYANLQNVFTITKYRGYDPEVGYMNGDALMSGLDYGRYPSPRMYTFGVTVSF